MNFITSIIVSFSMITLSLSSDCPDAVEGVIDDYVGVWYEYERSEISLSTGQCVKNTIAMLDDTNLSLINVQVDQNGESVTNNWTVTIEGKGLVVKDGTEVLGILNQLTKKQDDFGIYGACRDTQNIVSLVVLVNQKQPSQEVVDKISQALGSISNVPDLKLVDQSCS